jgi:glycosyltransferase involved in cell wall biosynthesis
MRIISILALTFIYGVAILLSYVSVFRKKKSSLEKKIIINGTFHNPNWFNAHVVPIVNSNYGEVVLITDEPIYELDNLIYSCPPRILSRMMTRAGAKFIWTIKETFKYKADLQIGYHIFPSAITSLIAAKLSGGCSCYQVTSGQLELAGGGYGAENRLLNGLQYESKYIEKLVNNIVRRFDLVIVRGSKAKAYIESTGYKNKLEVVTGSVLTDSHYIADERSTDVIFIGRLTEYKRPDTFLRLMRKVIEHVPNVSIKVVGDGPMMGELTEYAKNNQMLSNVEFLGKRKDVVSLLGRSKILVLTSRWEGVSIAMLEAMALGVVPVVVDVGDLSDYVHNNETGIIYNESEMEQIPTSICELLTNNSLLQTYSENARNYVIERCDRQVLSNRWLNILKDLTTSSTTVDK